MESTWMETTNYIYYLANGKTVSYSLSPDSDILLVIEELALQYVSKHVIGVPEQVSVRPNIFRTLEVQLNAKYNRIHLQNYSPPIGFSALQLQTLIGPLKIIPVANLEFPIFIGDSDEYKDNCFDSLLEEVLCA